MTRKTQATVEISTIKQRVGRKDVVEVRLLIIDEETDKTLAHVQVDAHTWMAMVNGSIRQLEIETDAPADVIVPAEPSFPLGRTWRPGDRVEYVGLDRKTRPGTVESIDRQAVWQERLNVRFDDGETRHINPDVMRHIRT